VARLSIATSTFLNPGSALDDTGRMDERDTTGGWGDWQDVGPVRPDVLPAQPPPGPPAAPASPQGGPPGPDGMPSDGSNPAFGAGYYPPSVEALFAAPRRRSGLSPVSLAAAACGALGFALGPILVGDPTWRYLVLAADIAALALGIYALVAAWRGFGRYDGAVFGMVLGGISLALWLSFVTSHPASGGT